MTKIQIQRTDMNDQQTLGRLIVLVDAEIQYRCHTLELPWLNNQSNISCIPAGTYKCRKRSSPKYRKHIHVLDVPGRSYILIHSGNFKTDTRGCILPGTRVVDLNADGLKDVASSRFALSVILKLVPDEFELSILE